MVLRAGPQAAERTVEFFTAQIRNPHTRAAYGTAVTRFFTWCDARGLELAQLSPIAALLHESSRARTMPPDRILTSRCEMTLVGRGRSSDSGSHSRGRPHSPAQLDSGREDHRR